MEPALDFMPAVLYSFPPFRLEYCIGGLLKRLTWPKKRESNVDMFVITVSIALYIRKNSNIIVLNYFTTFL